MRSLASARGTLLLVLAALFATGCNAYLAEEGDLTAPVLVQGRVVDASGGGMSGARVLVQVADDSASETGAAASIVYEGTFSAGFDGSFVVRLAPTPAITALAAESAGAVTVRLLVFADAAPFEFPRQLRSGTWFGEAPTFVFGPDGVTTPSGVPAVPTLSPAGA